MVDNWKKPLYLVPPNDGVNAVRIYDQFVTRALMSHEIVQAFGKTISRQLTDFATHCLSVGAGRDHDSATIGDRTLTLASALVESLAPTAERGTELVALQTAYRSVFTGIDEIYTTTDKLNEQANSCSGRLKIMSKRLSRGGLGEETRVLLSEAQTICQMVTGETIPAFAEIHPHIERLDQISRELRVHEDQTLLDEMADITEALEQMNSTLPSLYIASKTCTGQKAAFERVVSASGVSLLSLTDCLTYTHVRYDAGSIDQAIDYAKGAHFEADQALNLVKKVIALRTKLLGTEKDMITTALAMWDDTLLRHAHRGAIAHIHAIIFTICFAEFDMKLSKPIAHNIQNIAHTLIDIFGEDKERVIAMLGEYRALLISLDLVTMHEDGARITPTPKAKLWFHSGKCQPDSASRLTIRQLWTEKRDHGTFNRERHIPTVVALATELTLFQTSILSAIHEGFAQFESNQTNDPRRVVSAIGGIPQFISLGIRDLEGQFMKLISGGPDRQAIRYSKPPGQLPTLTLTEVGRALMTRIKNPFTPDAIAEIWIRLEEPDSRTTQLYTNLIKFLPG